MTHEQDHVVGALVDLCRAHNVKCVLQVGAGDGYEADCIRGAIGCRAVAVDGDSRSVPYSPSLEFHRSLIGATNCVTAFFTSPDNPELSTEIVRGEDFPHQTRHELMQRRVDTLCDYHGIRPDALIIDTEGTALDVLEGCGDAILSGLKVVYAEVQHPPLRGGMRIAEEVDAFLLSRGMVKHNALPSYGAGSQSNWTWVRP